MVALRAPIRVLLLATAAGIASMSVGHAASASFSGASLAVGAVSISRCTAAGLTVVQNLSGANVVSVTVGSVPAACGNATLLVTVASGANTGSGSATVPAAGGSVTVSLGTTIAAAASERIDLLMTGP